MKFANFNIFLGAMKNVATGRHSIISRKAKIALDGGTRRTGAYIFINASFMCPDEETNLSFLQRDRHEKSQRNMTFK